MHVAGNNVLEFKELMASEVELFLLKFEMFYKQNRDGRNTN
jgi:hypothetical protein